MNKLRSTNRQQLILIIIITQRVINRLNEGTKKKMTPKTKTDEK